MKVTVIDENQAIVCLQLDQLHKKLSKAVCLEIFVLKAAKTVHALKVSCYNKRASSNTNNKIMVIDTTDGEGERSLVHHLAEL